MLTCVRATKTYDDEWSDDDYVVFDGDHCIGHIMLTPKAPQDRPWFWTVFASDPHSTDDRGYTESRVQAIEALRARWLVGIEASTLAPR